MRCGMRERGALSHERTADRHCACAEASGRRNGSRPYTIPYKMHDALYSRAL
jgi:hypothetical protein